MRWSENETYQFVRLYLSHEHLWNPENTSYRLKSKRLKSYREIIAELNETTGILLNETELKIKIKNLRSTYMQEIAKIKQRSGPEWSYKPNMKWFAEWHKRFGGLKKTGEDPSTFDIQDSIDDANQKIWLSTEDNMEEQILDPFPEDEEYTLILKTEPREMPHINESRYQNKKKKIKCRRPSTDCSDRTYIESIDSSTENASKEDEFDIYGMYIASQLRKMDLQKALRVQLEIQSLISEARLSGLNGNH